MSITIPQHLAALSAVDKNVEATGLKPIHLRYLALICANDLIPMSAICGVMGDSSTVASRTLSTLTRDGYAVRSSDPTDFRVVRVKASPKGRTLDARIQRHMTQASSPVASSDTNGGMKDTAA